MRTALPTPEGCAIEVMIRQYMMGFGTHLDFSTALITDPSDQTLCEDSIDGTRYEKRLDSDVDEPGNG